MNIFKNICKQCKHYDVEKQFCAFGIECLALKKLSESALFKYFGKQLQMEEEK